jgi:hypothetical protein
VPPSGDAVSASPAQLRAGTGRRVRRELGLRSVAALVLAGIYGALAVYGASATADQIGVPFVVFGLAGALALLVLSFAMRTARRAITGDTYDRPAIGRARKAVQATLALLAIAAVVALIAGTVTLGGGLAGLTVLGLAAAFAVTADGWRTLRHLG